ncbi:hypothetical protein HAX54_043728 [Datura stramonium]|uniref:Uncharacterized protein n=1 Tax=Datura stramonium TaxID=4076 RepID=A0ABS8W5N3_DATST|nr:hypothetical protein [Datura stramonium]
MLAPIVRMWEQVVHKLAPVVQVAYTRCSQVGTRCSQWAPTLVRSGNGYAQLGTACSCVAPAVRRRALPACSVLARYSQLEGQSDPISLPY